MVFASLGSAKISTNYPQWIRLATASLLKLRPDLWLVGQFSEVTLIEFAQFTGIFHLKRILMVIVMVFHYSEDFPLSRDKF